LPKKDDLIMVGCVVAGVLITGWLMNQFSDVAMIDDAKRGFN